MRSIICLVALALLAADISACDPIFGGRLRSRFQAHARVVQYPAGRPIPVAFRTAPTYPQTYATMPTVTYSATGCPCVGSAVCGSSQCPAGGGTGICPCYAAQAQPRGFAPTWTIPGPTVVPMQMPVSPFGGCPGGFCPIR